MRGIISRQNKLIVFAVYVVLSTALEVVAFIFKGVFSVIASRIWLAGGFICVGTILVFFVYTMYDNFKSKKYLEIIGVCIIIFLLCRVWGNLQLGDISYEAAYQMKDALIGLKQPDWNYTGRAFLSYPARGYILTALPSVLFGRSIFSIQVGYGFIFVLSMLIFYIALRNRVQQYGQNTILALIPLYAILVFPYVTEFYLLFEQCIFPISYSMMAIGFFLLLTGKNPRMIEAFCLAWVGCLLSNCYTPVLATLACLIVFLGVYMFMGYRQYKGNPVTAYPDQDPLKMIKIFGLIEINITSYLVISYVGNQTLHGMQEFDISLIEVVKESLLNFFSDADSVFLGVFGIIVLIYMVAALLLQLTIRDFLLALWVMAVVVFANITKGYQSYVGTLNKHRAMILIPFIIVAVFLHVLRYLQTHSLRASTKKTVIILIAFVFIILQNFHLIHSVSNVYAPVNKFLIFSLSDTLERDHLNIESKFNLVFVSDDLIGNFYDYTGYFYPNATVYYSQNDGTFPEGIDTSLPTYVFGSEEISGQVLGEDVIEQKYLMATDKRRNLYLSWYMGKLG